MSTNPQPRIYNIPGEGLVCEIMSDGQPLLFDRLGLESRIVARRKARLDTDTEETALRMLREISGEGGGLPLFVPAS